MDRPLPDYLNEVCESTEVRFGSPFPFGAQAVGDGVNFAVFSRHATQVSLEFFLHPADAIAFRVVAMDSVRNRTGDVWHVWIQGIRCGQLYGFRMGGPYLPHEGHRFNRHRLLIDPCATALSRTPAWDFPLASGYDSAKPRQDLVASTIDNSGSVPKSIFLSGSFDWHDDRPLRHPWSKTVIYEVHVRGMTVHPSSGVKFPGTYRGLIEKIPYLKELGITALELMPIQEFNEGEIRPGDHRLGNYWGYDPISFFAPKASYCSAGGLGQQKLEFQEMVYALHQAGIEVILDIVFNHSAEGDERGPTISYRGIDNSIFYILDDDKRYYKDFTGTGNTINANHPVVRDHLLNALCYWVMEMHVDGFRFDLASVLGRDERGQLMPNAPLLERIAENPILRETKLIAEAWDVAGGYEVGSFSSPRWAEWNGRYRDDVRRYWRGDDGMVGLFASRICGSSDVYSNAGKGPECSINFITSHDGFTMNDLVTYRYKRNEANGEFNHDGANENFSCNWGCEGETELQQIEALRIRQIKNMLLTLFISKGVPMLLGGDEFRRSQKGNNNAFCQDNEISWSDWAFLERHKEIHRFTKRMIEFRTVHPVLSHERFYSESNITWFSPAGSRPDWTAAGEKRVACKIQGKDVDGLFLMFNADNQPADFVLPFIPDGERWQVAVDTAIDLEAPIPQIGKVYQVRSFSSVILVSPIRLPVT